jgi:hypothetical protein
MIERYSIAYVDFVADGALTTPYARAPSPRGFVSLYIQNWRGFYPRLSRLIDLAPLTPPFLLNPVGVTFTLMQFSLCVSATQSPSQAR